MKKIICLIICIFVFSLIGCNKTTIVSVNVENNEELYGDKFGVSNLIYIGNGLYYDSTTRIIYWWNGCLKKDSYYSNTPTAYYAPNGFPYKYNPETFMFEEIKIPMNK